MVTRAQVEKRKRDELLTDVQAAWIAAVIDCEGMLSIHTPWNKIRRNRNLQYNCRVQMTDEKIILQLQTFCGGSTRTNTRPKTHYRQSWCWNIYANGLRWLLPQLLPYLIVKQRHAAIAIEVLSKNSRGPGNQMSFETIKPLLYELRGLQKSGFPSDINKICATFREANYPHRVHKRDPNTRRFVCQ